MIWNLFWYENRLNDQIRPYMVIHDKLTKNLKMEKVTLVDKNNHSQFDLILDLTFSLANLWFS